MIQINRQCSAEMVPSIEAKLHDVSERSIAEGRRILL